MRVVVGAPDNKTPIFADEMTHVVFSPYWNVPPGIAKDETIPRALEDPGFLSRNNMEVVNTSGEVLDPDSVDWSNTEGSRIRQKPGQRQRAWRREIHLPEHIRRLSARYQRYLFVRSHRARPQPRLRPRRRAAQARAIRVARPAGVDARGNRRRHESGRGKTRQAQDTRYRFTSSTRRRGSTMAGSDS